MSRVAEPDNGSYASGAGAAPPTGNARPEDGALVRDLIRRAWKGALSTLERGGGHPYASLAAVATAADGAPLLLLSGLAEHTKNIAVDSRASLLIDGTEPGRAALTGPRVTLVGRIFEAPLPQARHRYLARHPDAAQFIDFPDFRLLALEVEWAHMVAGFGRIVRLARDDVIVKVDDAAEVLGAETSVLQHMNEDHADALPLLATLGVQAESAAVASSTRYPPISVGTRTWRMIGCDVEGVDLTDGELAVRLRFAHRVTTVEQVRNAIVSLVDAARKEANKHG